ncbi:major facilitator superfamily domain-containing protein [Aspergillus insuetus]
MGIFKKGRLTVADDTVTNAAQLTLRQSLLPNILVTVLFFLWGFAYGLLDVLNSHFQTTLNITQAKASGLSASYFGAYFLCPLTISDGSSDSFGGFCGSMFIVGAGLSTLETAADPFLAICGPPKYSEIRLNLAQAVQGVGGFVAPLLASRVFFAHTVDDDQGLKNVQWVYLGVAGFVGLLIILFLFVPFPEITDADMGAQEAEISDHDSGPFRAQYTLFLGVFSQFCYVGAQVAVANYFINFAVEAGKDKAEASDLFAVAQAVYAANRFIAGGLMVIPAFKPRYMLLVYLSMCIVFSIICIVTKGTASVAMLIMVFVFESCCFATIFLMSMRGLGRHTKRGGSFLVAAISGGAVFPPMMGAVVTHEDAHTAMAIPMMGYVLTLTFPIYVNLFQKERMDSHRVSAQPGGVSPV